MSSMNIFTTLDISFRRAGGYSGLQCMGTDSWYIVLILEGLCHIRISKIDPPSLEMCLCIQINMFFICGYLKDVGKLRLPSLQNML